VQRVPGIAAAAAASTAARERAAGTDTTSSPTRMSGARGGRARFASPADADRVA